MPPEKDFEIRKTPYSTDEIVSMMTEEIKTVKHHSRKRKLERQLDQIQKRTKVQRSN